MTTPASPPGGTASTRAPISATATGRFRFAVEASHVGCLFANGGSNVGTVNPFNVLRRAIHREFTDEALLLKCLGWR